MFRRTVKSAQAIALPALRSDPYIVLDEGRLF